MREILLSVAASLCPTYSGCNPPDDLNETLTMAAADAKQALTGLLEKTEDTDLKRLLEPFKKSEGKAAEEGKVVNFGP
jgi:hypothetical protein